MKSLKSRNESQLCRLLLSADDRLSVQMISIKNLYTADLFQSEILYKCRSINRITIAITNNSPCHLIARACIRKCECECDTIQSGYTYSIHVILSFMNCAYRIAR